MRFYISSSLLKEIKTIFEDCNRKFREYVLFSDIPDELWDDERIRELKPKLSELGFIYEEDFRGLTPLFINCELELVIKNMWSCNEDCDGKKSPYKLPTKIIGEYGNLEIRGQIWVIQPLAEVDEESQYIALDKLDNSKSIFVTGYSDYKKDNVCLWNGRPYVLDW